MALRRDDETDHAPTQRIERIEHFHEPGAAPAASTNVNVGPATTPADAVTVVTRVVMVVFTALELLVLFRFTLKLGGANSGQPLVSWLYAFTEPLVRPFQGIFPEPRVGTVIDIASLLAIVFLLLISWLIVALTRAIVGRPA